MPCLAFGASRCRRRRRRLLLLPFPLPASHLPCALPPPLHRTILSRAATERHFSEEELPVVVGIREGIGESSLATRNNGVLPTYPRGFFVLGEGSKGFPSGGRRRQDGVFGFLNAVALASKARILSISPFVYPAVRTLTFPLFKHWFSTNPPCKIPSHDPVHSSVTVRLNWPWFLRF